MDARTMSASTKASFIDASAKTSGSVSGSDASRAAMQSQSHLSRSIIASFRHQNLNMESVVRIMAQLDNIKALDLSYNKLTTLPKLLPPKMIAIDLSYNPIRGLQGFTDVANLVELKLNYNKIESCLGLATAINLEYLELSHNRIAQVEGLENCSNLRSINLSYNAITTTLHIRPLSLNLLLGEVDLRGNAITDVKQYRIAVMGFLTALSRLDNISVRSAGSKAAKNYSQKFDDRMKGIIKHDPSLRYLAEGAVYSSGYYNGNGEYNSHYTNDSDEEGDVKIHFDESASQLPWRRPPNPAPNPLRFERKSRRGGMGGSFAGSSSTAANHHHHHHGPHHDGRPPSQRHHHKGLPEAHLLHTQAESAAGKYYMQHRREQSSSSKHRQQLQSHLPGSPRKDSKWSSPELSRRSKPASRAELILGLPLQSPSRGGRRDLSYLSSRSNIENESNAFANISANTNLNISAASSAMSLPPPPLPAEMSVSSRRDHGSASFEKSSLERLWSDEAAEERRAGFSLGGRLHDYSDIYYDDDEDEEDKVPPQQQKQLSVYGSLRLLHEAINAPPSQPSARPEAHPPAPARPALTASPEPAPAPARAAPSVPSSGTRLIQPGHTDSSNISSADIKRALFDLMQRKQTSLHMLQEAKMRTLPI